MPTKTKRAFALTLAAVMAALVSLGVTSCDNSAASSSGGPPGAPAQPSAKEATLIVSAELANGGTISFHDMYEGISTSFAFPSTGPGPSFRFTELTGKNPVQIYEYLLGKPAPAALVDAVVRVARQTEAHAGELLALSAAAPTPVANPASSDFETKTSAVVTIVQPPPSPDYFYSGNFFIGVCADPLANGPYDRAPRAPFWGFNWRYIPQLYQSDSHALAYFTGVACNWAGSSAGVGAPCLRASWRLGSTAVVTSSVKVGWWESHILFASRASTFSTNVAMDTGAAGVPSYHICGYSDW